MTGRRTALAALLVAGAWAAPATAAELVALPGRTVITAPVKSMMELRFVNVVRQAYDVSCGAAALSTLLTYYYDLPVGEQQIIETVLKNSSEADKENINRYGFSMLELKRAGEFFGFAAGGFRITDIERLARLKVPALTLVTIGGYKHFVVIKGIQGGQVYLADPAFGNRSRSLRQFAKEWNSVVLVFVSNTREGRGAFTFEGTTRGRAGDVVPFLDQGARPPVRVPGEF